MTVADLSLVRVLEGELLGPESAFAVLRSERRREWEPIVLSAATLEVADEAGRSTAVEHGRLLQAAGRSLEELYRPIKQQIDTVKKVVLDAEKADLNQVNGSKAVLAAKVQAWTEQQARLERERQRAAEAEARRQEEEQRLQEAIAAEQAGETAEAEAILEAPVLPPPVMVQQSAKVAGQVERTTYSAQVTSLMALVRAVAEGKVPLQAVKADEAFLNGQARLLREGMQYSGVTVHKSVATHFRS